MTAQDYSERAVKIINERSGLITEAVAAFAAEVDRETVARTIRDVLDVLENKAKLYRQYNLSRQLHVVESLIQHFRPLVETTEVGDGS